MIIVTDCIKCGIQIFRSIDAINPICVGCNIKEKRNMPNIKITAEVDGKQVPLHTVSTETFEAIKALEKPKEIPVARLATCSGLPRLLFKPKYDMNLRVGRIYALSLKCGEIALDWELQYDIRQTGPTGCYKNVQPL